MNSTARPWQCEPELLRQPGECRGKGFLNWTGTQSLALLMTFGGKQARNWGERSCSQGTSLLVCPLVAHRIRVIRKAEAEAQTKVTDSSQCLWGAMGTQRTGVGGEA